MKKLMIILGLLGAFSVWAKDVPSTISEIEFEKEAQCHKISESMDFCLNYVCVNYQSFQCLGNTEVFKVKLKVVTKKLGNGSYKETVKKVKYIK